ncbi:hypothetical protein A0H81_06483 [Grifola frondosa]|uniref:Uncharacterized protein n=1 Tax=Grifola frondosa TaxID=5627 RepID=A0A1C7M9W5_GRIFR|nr:hypothetical protein A0H81_06483 [Grifola frondosa]
MVETIGIPLVTQSDPGTENFGVANCHTEIRHRLDPSLADTLQHRWMRHKSNIKPEIMWSQLRRKWSPGFENILEHGRLNGLYDPANPLEKLVFLWLAIPWLQAELDAYMKQFNGSQRRADKNKILPHGIPDVITAKPERFNTTDFKVLVSPEIFDDAEAKWAPRDHPVFHLVPPEFGTLADKLYSMLGNPAVNSDSFWTVYVSLLAAFRQLPQVPDFSASIQTQGGYEEEEVPELPNLRALRHGEEGAGPQNIVYAGGLEDPPTFPGAAQSDVRIFADFSDIELEGPDDDEDVRIFADFTQVDVEREDTSEIE